jgi:hypothetical protein
MTALRQFALATSSLLMLALAPVGAAWAQVKVTAATPSVAYQGTVSVDVVVSGSGFDKTAKVQYFVSGTTNPGGITVKKVAFNSSNQLVTTIDVADTANIANFDIVVMLDSGRKGKGTSLFAVQSKTSDPCARPGLDFPAFTYWKASGNTRQLYVADATGVCSRSIMTLIGAAGARLTYPVPGMTNVGRILYPDDSGSLDWVDFIVNHADNTIVLGTGAPIAALTNLFAWTLAPDGTTVYYSTGPGAPDGFPSIYRLPIDGSQPPQEIYRSLVAGSAVAVLSASADGSKLAVEEVANIPTEHHRVLLIPLPCTDNNTCAKVLAENSANLWPALNSAGTTVAISDYQAGSNNCWQLRFIDTASGTALFAGGQPRYGIRESWLDDQLLVNSRKPPDRKNACQDTGNVVSVDPATSAETTLLSGSAPDAR